MMDTIKMATDLNIAEWGARAEGGGLLEPTDAMRVFARLDFERKRADEAEYNLQVSNPAQRRREIWEHACGIYEACVSCDRGALFSDCINQAGANHAAFTASMDAEKGGGE